MIPVFEGEYAFLSNFYESPFDFMGTTYQSVEHFYQAAKAVDPLEADIVVSSATPGESKKQGRRIECRDDWDEVKISVMRFALEMKFMDPVLRQKLLDTGDHSLFEGNVWGDTFWGVDTRTGQGKNHLGKLLMELREKYRKDHG